MAMSDTGEEAKVLVPVKRKRIVSPAKAFIETVCSVQGSDFDVCKKPDKVVTLIQGPFGKRWACTCNPLIADPYRCEANFNCAVNNVFMDIQGVKMLVVSPFPPLRDSVCK